MTNHKNDPSLVHDEVTFTIKSPFNDSVNFSDYDASCAIEFDRFEGNSDLIENKKC